MPISDKEEENFSRNKEKGEDDYEKNVIYIAAGTLVLSLTFLEKIVNLKESNAVWFLIWSWIFLSLTLFCNLLSHQLSVSYSETCRIAYLKCGEDRTVPDKLFDKFFGRVNFLNWVSTGSLFVGIALLVTFCSINAVNISQSKSKDNCKIMSTKEIKPQIHQPDLQKGRVPSQPVSVPIPQPKAPPVPNPPKQ